MVAISTVALGASVVSSVLGFGASRSAKRRQRRAEALQRKRSAIANIQNRRAAAAAIRRQQAVQVVGAMASGAAGGSADKATASSLASQGLASIATQTQQQELGGQINAQIAAANKYSAQASTFNAIAGLAGQVASFASAGKPPAQQDQIGLTAPTPPILPIPPTPNPHTR